MTVRYVFDPGASRFTVQAFAGGLLSVFAHNPTFAVRAFTGELTGTPGNLADASLRITVQADALELLDNVSPRDREEIVRTMWAEVLETSTYAEIAFRSTSVQAVRLAESWHRLVLRGDLLLHGVRNEQAIDAQLRTSEEGVRLTGEFGLVLSSYHIKRVSALGGTIKLKDELKVAFDLVGRPDGSSLG
jgi:polyisoprenoid-binding protein YceI